MRRLLFALLLLALPAAAQEELKDMAANVRDYRTKFRLISRGRAALPYLMAQIGSQDKWIAFESKSTVRWIVNHARRDPRKRRIMVGEIELYCGQPATRAFAAELLGDLGDPAAVRALTPLLGEEDAAEAAADALRRTPGEAAVNALLAGANTSPARNTIYAALGARRVAAARTLLLDAAGRGNANAMRALAAIGETEFLLKLARAGIGAAFEALVENADARELVALWSEAKSDEQRRVVLDAAAHVRAMDLGLMDLLLGALDNDTLRVPAQHAVLAVAEKAEPATAAPFVRSILADAKDTGVIVRALAGCARTRDTQAVALAVKYLDSPSGNIRTTAIGALRDIPGEDAMNALLDAFEREQDPGALSLYINTLAERGDPRAAKLIAGHLAEGPEEVRNTAIAAYVRLAGRADEATGRTMYLRSLDAGVTRAAIVGLGRVGDASVVERLASVEGDLAVDARGAMVEIAERLPKAESIPVLKRALDAGAPVENRLRELGEQVTFTARGGLLHAWWIIGPFPAKIEEWARPEFPEKKVDLAGGEGEMRWRPVASDGEDAIVDLDGQFTPNNTVTAYAYAEIIVKKERDAVLKVGSDDGIVCWINGEKVHENLVLRGVTVDEDSVKVHLKKGSNAVLVKVCESAGGWAFCARLEDEQGRPLKFKIK